MQGFIHNSSAEVVNLAVNMLSCPNDLMQSAFCHCLCFGLMCLMWKISKRFCPKYRERKRKDKEIYHQIMKESQRKEKQNQDLVETNRKLTSEMHCLRSNGKDLRNKIIGLERTIEYNDNQLLDACTRLTASENETKVLQINIQEFKSALNKLECEFNVERHEREIIERKYFQMLQKLPDVVGQNSS
ncbi:uncharacterized protein LOC117124547 [Anneissia japonica]|uniref:uncharacterized protein LOC117124547 n=1 Tax=Anneissia japonica TaxID=1529436 RepID=UPI001425AA0F|nr:uncharacterized protein LOC117124547 [Anneissia japonica]